MHQIGPIDILVMAGLFAVGLVVERLLRGRLGWLDAALWLTSGRASRMNRPPRATGVQEDDDVHWNWSARH